MGMAKFAKVLNSVISLHDIRKVTTIYENGTNYNNKWVHSMFVEYYDGKQYEFSTTDKEQAKKDFGGLENAILGLKDDFCSYGERKDNV